MNQGDVYWYTFRAPDKRRPVLILTRNAVNLDNIQTVRKAGLGRRLTRLSLERMREVRAAVEFALGFDALA
jgi:mRNA-degrading endonuclease toxin of MazEF toxin-antitoxin module